MPKERMPEEGSDSLMVKVGCEVHFNWAFFWDTWASDNGAQPPPDFWAYNPKGPQ